MYRIIEIDGREYKLTYSVEASLYKDCAETVSNFMLNATTVEAIENFVTTMTDIPRTALICFYAGLMEEHGTEGDCTVLSIADAKALVKKYFAEHKEDGEGNFYALLRLCLEQMNEDVFFEQIGLSQIAQTLFEEEEKPVKKPQDHKKKSTTAK